MSGLRDWQDGKMHEEENRTCRRLSYFSTTFTAKDSWSAKQTGCNISLNRRWIWSESARQQTYDNCACVHSSYCPWIRYGGRRKQQCPKKVQEDSKAPLKEQAGGEEGTADGCGSQGGPGFRQGQQHPQHWVGHWGRGSAPSLGLRKWESETLTRAAWLFCKWGPRLFRLLKEYLVFLCHF